MFDNLSAIRYASTLVIVPYDYPNCMYIRIGYYRGTEEEEYGSISIEEYGEGRYEIDVSISDKTPEIIEVETDIWEALLRCESLELKYFDGLLCKIYKYRE